jgi:hypothetical protein
MHELVVYEQAGFFAHGSSPGWLIASLLGT